jgi:anti-anti-sigma factor
MSVSLHLQDGNATLSINGKFTFEVHRDFSELTDRALSQADCKRLDIDLAGVIYLDSSALGMLLLAKDKAHTSGKPLRLVGATGTTLQILQVAKFQGMFEFA